MCRRNESPREFTAEFKMEAVRLMRERLAKGRHCDESARSWRSIRIGCARGRESWMPRPPTRRRGSCFRGRAIIARWR